MSTLTRNITEPAIAGATEPLRAREGTGRQSRGTRIRRVLAVASGGGHWVELIRLGPALEGHDVAYVTVSEAYRDQVGGARFYTIRDATRWNKLGAVMTAWQILKVLVRERPDVVLTTGALPGYLAIRLARWFGAKTLWLDSIANAQELSLAGRLVGPYADLWLTQWPELAGSERLQYVGSVL